MSGPIRVMGAIYRVYVKHDWGTEKLTVTLRKTDGRSVKKAGKAGELRALSMGRTGVVVVDVVPCRYVAGKLVESRRLRRQKGKTVTTRKPKARKSARENRRRALGATA